MFDGLFKTTPKNNLVYINKVLSWNIYLIYLFFILKV